FDINTGQVVQDYIKVLKVNTEINPVTTGLSDPNAEISFEEGECGLGTDTIMNFSSVYRENDGYIDTKRINLTFTDSDGDGVPDDPTAFEAITSLTKDNLYLTLPNVIIDSTELFFEYVDDADGYQVRSVSSAVVAALNTE